MTTGKPQSPSQALAKLLGTGGPAKSNTLGLVAAGVFGATLVVLLLLARPLLRHTSTAVSTDDKQVNQDDAAAKFDQSITTYVAQIEGRSPFYLPLKNPKVEEVEDKKPAATRYGGPQIVAMVNNAVWFANGDRLEVGQSDKSGDLKVVSLRAPWSAKIAWQGGEFTVDFFQRSPLLTGKTDTWKPSPMLDEPARPLAPRAASPANGPGSGRRAEITISDQPVVIEIAPATPEPGAEAPTPPPAPRDPPPRGEPPPTPANPAPSTDPAPAAPAPGPATPPAEPEKLKP